MCYHVRVIFLDDLIWGHHVLQFVFWLFSYINIGGFQPSVGDVCLFVGCWSFLLEQNLQEGIFFKRMLSTIVPSATSAWHMPNTVTISPMNKSVYKTRLRIFPLCSFSLCCSERALSFLHADFCLGVGIPHKMPWNRFL